VTPIIIDASAIRVRDKMLKRYGKFINHVRPRYSKSDASESGPPLCIEGLAVVFNEPIALQTGEIVVFEPGCFDKYLANRETDFLLAHDSTEIIGSTNSGLELCASGEGLAFRMPLTNQRYAATIKRMVESNSQSAISVGVTWIKAREQAVGKHNVVFAEEVDLREVSLVGEGCCHQAFASLIDANDSPSLKASVNSPSFKLESVAHNVRTQFRKKMRTLEALTERITALKQMPEPVRSMTAYQHNALDTQRIEQMQSERRAMLGM
jgi:HK97 family phage prohead protease